MLPTKGPDERHALTLRIEDLQVTVPQRAASRRSILSVDHIELPAGGRVAVVGPSGAGKSSLLGVLSGIVKPDAGRLSWGGDDIAVKSETARDRWRRRHIGLVFQEFHLIPELCALGNVLMPARFATWRTARSVENKAEELLASVGLRDIRRRAGLLSRGEQQRTAIARALLNDPAIILADEPTASLDVANGRAIADLLVETAERLCATLVVATHDPALIERLGTRWQMSAGHIAEVAP